MKPEKMFTWVVALKHTSAARLNRDLRILLSRDGELSVYEATNQLILTDWISSLRHAADIIAQLDKPVDSNTSKLVQNAAKEVGKQKADRAEKKTSTESHTENQ